jgi:Ni,Fe-hydrogenase III large subunit
MRHDAGSPPAFELGSDPYPFLKVEGTGVYEIPVGPVHAGMIEPGHFRFSVVGETILKLKARLWFVHRGLEKLFEGRDPYDGVQLAERISGDSAAAHSLAYALAVEDALGWEISAEAQIGRALVVEMERVYNHVADLGALANDVGYGIINSHALRIRERLLRLNEKLTGHRLLRDAISPGATNLLQVPSDSDMAEIAADASDLADVVLANSTVRDRFRGTSVLSREDASQLGCLGYVARASGLEIDARVDHPHCRVSAEAKIHHGGDVLARFLIRRDELDESFRLIGELTSAYGPTRPGLFTQMPQVRGKSSGVGIVEGWRGTTVHRVEITDGHLSRVKVVDPSWFNWPALPVALRDTIVPDFPLTNKSFNLSYAGNDL